MIPVLATVLLTVLPTAALNNLRWQLIDNELVRNWIRTYVFYFWNVRSYFNVRHFGVSFVRETYAAICRCHCIVSAFYYHCIVRLWDSEQLLQVLETVSLDCRTWNVCVFYLCSVRIELWANDTMIPQSTHFRAKLVDQRCSTADIPLPLATLSKNP